VTTYEKKDQVGRIECRESAGTVGRGATEAKPMGEGGKQLASGSPYQQKWKRARRDGTYT